MSFLKLDEDTPKRSTKRGQLNPYVAVRTFVCGISGWCYEIPDYPRVVVGGWLINREFGPQLPMRDEHMYHYQYAAYATAKKARRCFRAYQWPVGTSWHDLEYNTGEVDNPGLVRTCESGGRRVAGLITPGEAPPESIARRKRVFRMVLADGAIKALARMRIERGKRFIRKEKAWANIQPFWDSPLFKRVQEDSKYLEEVEASCWNREKLRVALVGITESRVFKRIQARNEFARVLRHTVLVHKVAAHIVKAFWRMRHRNVMEELLDTRERTNLYNQQPGYDSDGESYFDPIRDLMHGYVPTDSTSSDSSDSFSSSGSEFSFDAYPGDDVHVLALVHNPDIDWPEFMQMLADLFEPEMIVLEDGPLAARAYPCPQARPTEGLATAWGFEYFWEGWYYHARCPVWQHPRISWWEGIPYSGRASAPPTVTLVKPAASLSFSLTSSFSFSITSSFPLVITSSSPTHAFLSFLFPTIQIR